MHQNQPHAAYAIDVQNIIFSFEIKTRTNARTYPNLRLDHQKCILEKFHVILYAHNKDALIFLRRIITYDVRERKMLFYFTLIHLTTENATRLCIRSTWLNHHYNSSLYWDILLPNYRRWWQYFNWVCILVCVSQLCQKVYIQVIICISYFFLGNWNNITQSFFYFSNKYFYVTTFCCCKYLRYLKLSMPG